MEELEAAYKKLKTGKAPGPDKITPEMVKLACETCPRLILRTLNELIKAQEFPKTWKVANVVLIPKATKEGEERKFRTICLINSIAKLFEHIIKGRLQRELDDLGAISDRQYGFRPSRSTIDALRKVLDLAVNHRCTWGAIITIDVQNAFNTARWSIIAGNLVTAGVSEYLIRCIENYLKDRRLRVGHKELAMTQGVPQGSVLGPLLWNVLYNPVLEIELPEGCDTVAYADDLVLVVKNDRKDLMMKQADEALEAIRKWMIDNKLEIASSKTEALIIKGPRKREDIIFTIGGSAVHPQKFMKYLGVWLDDKQRFNQHIRKTTEKAAKTAGALNRIMPNIGGMSSRRRELMHGVVMSILTYAAPIWHKVTCVRTYKEMLGREQRKIALRVASAYKTAPTEGLCVIAGLIPIDLYVAEKVNIEKEKRRGKDIKAVRKEEREKTVHMWQRRWAELHTVAQWTKELIPEVESWYRCKHRKTNYFMTQFLTGHGSFGSYTFRIKKTATEACRYCGQRDTPLHTFFQCQKWERERIKVSCELGNDINSDNIVAHMLRNRSSWGKIEKFITKILASKEKDEREAQKAQADRL